MMMHMIPMCARFVFVCAHDLVIKDFAELGRGGKQICAVLRIRDMSALIGQDLVWRNKNKNYILIVTNAIYT